MLNRLRELFRPAPPEVRFWRWFRRHSDRVFQFEKDQDRVFDALGAELAKVREGLTFEFGPVRDGTREFAISADGLSELIPTVQSLVAAAPALPQWQILAFRKRKPHGANEIRVGDWSLPASDVWFKAHPPAPGARIDLDVAIRGYDAAQPKYTRLAMFLLLDDVIGEYDVMTKIGVINVAPLPEAPGSHGLRPLTELADVVDAAFPRH